MVRIPRLSYLLRQAQLANLQQLDAVVQAHGLTPAQYIVLSVVKEHRDGTSSAMLARRLGVTPQSSHEIVAGLERRKLVKRIGVGRTRRMLKITLSAAGTALLQECDAAVEAFECRFFGSWSRDEQRLARGLLERLIRDTRERAAAESLTGT
jgi:DNA-binding MarR family transcriptional regulator